MNDYRQNLLYVNDIINTQAIILSDGFINKKNKNHEYYTYDKLTKNKFIILLKRQFKYIVIFDFESLLNKLNLNFFEFLNLLKNNISKTNLLIQLPNFFSLKNINKVNRNVPHNSYIYNKEFIEENLKINNFEYKFYYIFPETKYPEIIMTDEFLKKKIYVSYKPIYSKNENYILDDEINLYKEKFYEGSLPFYANDFFIEISSRKIVDNINFLKFNNYRNENFALYTFCKNNKFYKNTTNSKQNDFFNNYKKSCLELKQEGFDVIDIKHDRIGYYTEENKYLTFFDKIIKEFDGIDSLYKNFKIYKEYLFEKYENRVTPSTNVFNEYNIDIPNDLEKKLSFVEKGYIDIIPQNMIIIKDKFYLIDQEWFLYNVPVEFIIYRGIINTAKSLEDSENLIKNCMQKLDLLEFLPYFYNLEKNFHESIESKKFEKIRNSNMKNILEENKKLNFEIKELNKKISDLQYDYNRTINSSSWKITKPLRNLKKYRDKIIKK